MLAFVAPLLAFLTVPNGEGDELAAMRAAVEAGLPSTAAGPQRESRTVISSNTCSDTPDWTNPHGWGCASTPTETPCRSLPATPSKRRRRSEPRPRHGHGGPETPRASSATEPSFAARSWRISNARTFVNFEGRRRSRAGDRGGL